MAGDENLVILDAYFKDVSEHCSYSPWTIQNLVWIPYSYAFFWEKNTENDFSLSQNARTSGHSIKLMDSRFSADKRKLFFSLIYHCSTLSQKVKQLFRWFTSAMIAKWNLHVQGQYPLWISPFLLSVLNFLNKSVNTRSGFGSWGCFIGLSGVSGWLLWKAGHWNR